MTRIIAPKAPSFLALIPTYFFPFDQFSFLFENFLSTLIEPLPGIRYLSSLLASMLPQTLNSLIVHITLISQNYLPYMGGVETHAQQVAHALKNLGHTVNIVAYNFEGSKLPPRWTLLHRSVLAPSYEDFKDGDVIINSLAPSKLERFKMIPMFLQATPIVSRHFYHGLNRFSYFWYRAALLKRLRSLIKKADVVHSLSFGHLGWLAQEAARLEGVPFVCTPFVHPHQWGDGPDDIRLYQRSEAVIGLVKTDRDYLESIGIPREKLHTVGVSPNLPPTQNPEDFRRRHGLEGVPLVLYVGRMMAKKGAESVIAAAQHIWKKFPQTHFVFIGPGSSESEKWFESTDSRIHYLGRVEKQEKADALAACDIFCMPSLSEILPTVYLEAWSYGKPVVGGWAHGLPELIESNHAGLASSQDPLELSTTIEKLLQDPAMRHRLGSNGYELVQNNYAVPAVTSALLSIYSDALTQSKAKPRHN